MSSTARSGKNDGVFRFAVLIAALFFLLFVALPGLFPLLSCLTGPSARRILTELLTSQRQGVLLLRSLGIAIGVAALSTFLGGTCGFLIEHSRLRYRRWLYLILTTNFLIPPYIFALAWIDLSGHAGLLRSLFPQSETARVPMLYSFIGTVLVQSLSYYPIAALATAIAFRRVDGRFEQAARLFASKWRVFRAVTLPLILPGILTGFLIIFMFSLVDFTVPSLLQVNTYPVEIYTRFSTSFDFNDGFAQSIPLVVVALSALLLWRFVLRPRFGWLASEERKTLAYEASGFWPYFFCATIMLISPLLPMIVIIWRAWPLTSLWEAFMTAKEELFNSALTAMISATAVTLTAFLIGYCTRIRPHHKKSEGKVRSGAGKCHSEVLRGIPLSKHLSRFALLLPSAIPFVISGPVLGIALIRIWNHAGIRGAVYDSFLILSLACLARFFFIGERGASMIFNTIDRRIEDPARLAGVPVWSRLWRVHFPLCRSALMAVWAFVFILSIGELGASVLVAPPGFTPLSVRLFSLMHYGPSRLIAALSLIMVAVVAFGAAFALRFVERMERERP